MFITVAILM